MTAPPARKRRSICTRLTTVIVPLNFNVRGNHAFVSTEQAPPHSKQCPQDSNCFRHKRRKITAEQGSGVAVADPIRYDPPSGESCGEPAPVLPGSPALLAIVAVAPTLPPTESSDVAKVKKTAVLTVIKTVTTVTTTVTTRVSRASPRATSSPEEEPLGENSTQPAPSDSGVAAPAASEYLLSASPRTRSDRVVLPGEATRR
ncbi:hypothetical protein PF008_g2403 [Phytophthora fragariae]|uniref:Uncharacterized protein n=1 Tax=Phytophthora fragariae TaxID=53985 RepID=A0A6G0SIA3_9STRA|nr:hypothetical protein PF008_g2403 [Phytophthora fragariae]